MPYIMKVQSGVLVLVYYREYSKTVSVGYWAGVGSRDENDGSHGFSHFVEHMIFKGTKLRDSRKISFEIDEIGGEINGATAKEFTYYYVNVATDFFERAVEVLTDIFFNPRFRRSEFLKEKMVILDELESSQDDPEEYVNDLFSSALWGKTSFGLPVIGTKEDIEGATLSSLKEFYHRYYTPDRLVISIAGGIEPGKAGLIVERALKNFGQNRLKRYTGYTRNITRLKPEPLVSSIFKEKSIEQVYFLAGRESYSYRDTKRLPMILLNSIIGGSFSSILFQEVREKLGLCYSISSSYLTYSDTGEFSIGFSSTKKNFRRVVDVIISQIKKMIHGTIKDEDLERAKNRFYGNMSLASESNEWLMSRMAVHQMMFGRIIPLEEVQSMVRRINLTDIYSVIEDLFKGKEFSIAVVGSESAGKMLENVRISFN